MKKIGTIITVLILLLVIVGLCFVGYGYYKKATMEVKNPIVTMEVENFGTVKMELYPEQAPDTVANFVTLINRGFYNDLTFHRILKDFMIQGGDKNGDGSGSPKLSDLRDLAEGEEDKEYAIKGEFIANGVENKIKFEEGVVAMARSDFTAYSSELAEESYNSEGSQFFIMTTNDNTSLQGYYAPFGKVTEGMDVVKKIAEVEVKAKEKDSESEATSAADSEVSVPVNPPKIKSMTVDTFGYDYGLPQTSEPFNYLSWLYEQYGIDPSSLEQ